MKSSQASAEASEPVSGSQARLPTGRLATSSPPGAGLSGCARLPAQAS